MKQRNQPLIIIVNGTQAFKINDTDIMIGIFIFMLKLLKIVNIKFTKKVKKNENLESSTTTHETMLIWKLQGVPRATKQDSW